MAYLPRRGRAPRFALSGVENCGADQVWDPNIVAFGMQGQCMPRKNYTAAQLENPNAYPGVVKSSSSGSSTAGNLLGALLGGLLTPKAPPPPVYMPPASTGISTTTAVAIGVGALALLFVATR